jgi:hypothetical protein
VNQVDPAELLRPHQRSHLTRHRVKPVGEGDGIDHTGILGNPCRQLCIVQADAERLFAEHMFAGLHQSDRVRNVRGVRRTDVHDLRFALRDFVDTAVRLLDPPGLGDFPRALRAGRHHPEYLGSCQHRSPPVYFADHAGT